MRITPETSLSDLAFIVGNQLAQSGTTAVLSGGGAATVWAPEANQSRDLDFILGFWSSLGASKQPLYDLGFRERGQVFRHPDTIFTVEFPPGPLAIGDEIITSWSTLERDERKLHILSPTDSVRDRLAWFIYNNDFSGMDQATEIALCNEIDLDTIKRWCEQEKASRKFDIFHETLVAKAHSRRNQ